MDIARVLPTSPDHNLADRNLADRNLGTHAETASAAPANAPADPVASPAGTQVVPAPTISDQVFWDAALKGDKATVRAGLRKASTSMLRTLVAARP